MDLDANAIDEVAHLQQLDDLEVARRSITVVGDAEVIEYQLCIREELAGQRERVDDPVPSSGARTAQGVEVIAFSRTVRRIVQRLVHYVDLLQIRELARNGGEPDADCFLLLCYRQGLDPGRLLTAPEQIVPLEDVAIAARLVIRLARRIKIEHRIGKGRKSLIRRSKRGLRLGTTPQATKNQRHQKPVRAEVQRRISRTVGTAQEYGLTGRERLSRARKRGGISRGHRRAADARRTRRIQVLHGVAGIAGPAGELVEQKAVFACSPREALGQ